MNITRTVKRSDRESKKYIRNIENFVKAGKITRVYLMQMNNIRLVTIWSVLTKKSVLFFIQVITLIIQKGVHCRDDFFQFAIQHGVAAVSF
jgi:hypothetical protein